MKKSVLSNTCFFTSETLTAKLLRDLEYVLIKNKEKFQNTLSSRVYEISQNALIPTTKDCFETI